MLLESVLKKIEGVNVSKTILLAYYALIFKCFSQMNKSKFNIKKVTYKYLVFIVVILKSYIKYL